MAGAESDHRLSLAAVGLWHRIASGGRPVESLELLTLAGDPTEWHPEGRLDDVAGALHELLALGWVIETDSAYTAVLVE